MDNGIQITRRFKGQISEQEIEQINDIEQDCIHDPAPIITKEEIVDYFTNRGDVINYVINDAQNSHVVGYVTLVHLEDKWYVANIAIRRDCRRKGYGEKALKMVDSDIGCNSIKLRVVEVHCSTDNDPARILYQKLGYVITQRLHDHYSEGVDAFVLRKEVQPWNKNKLNKI